MTPALVELARAYVATEGAIRENSRRARWDVSGADTFIRTVAGARFVWDVDRAMWLPDLRDAATGGVMLVHHGVISTDKGGRKNQPSFGVFLKGVGWFYGASYGEAVAKAHVAKAKKEGA